MLGLICDFCWCGKEFYATSDIILPGDVYSNSHFVGAEFALLIYFEHCIAVLWVFAFTPNLWVHFGLLQTRVCVCMYCTYVYIYLYFYSKFAIWMFLGLVTVEIAYCKSLWPVLASTWNHYNYNRDCLCKLYTQFHLCTNHHTFSFQEFE